MKSTLGLRLGMLIVVLAAASLACEFSGNTKTSKGERVISNENGFSFTPPAGTVVSDLGFIGIDVAAAKADQTGDFVLGPKCFGTTTNSHTSLEDNARNYWISAAASSKNNVGLALGDYQEMSVADHFALEGEEAGSYLASIDAKETPIYGKRLDVQVEGEQVFTLSCDGPESRKEETLSLYNSLKESLQFFSPMTPTPEE
jgi:hypothetical protein